MDETVNKIKNLPLVTIDIKELYEDGKRVELNFEEFLKDGLLIEKDFRKTLLNYNWEKFNNSFVYVTYGKDLIIPSWSYLLLSYYLSKNSKDFVIGFKKNLEEKLYNKKINELDFKSYDGKKVIIKGCSEIPFSEYVYFELTRKLSKVAYSLMYGEPCSRVPIFRNKNKKK